MAHMGPPWGPVNVKICLNQAMQHVQYLSENLAEFLAAGHQGSQSLNS